MRAASYFLPGVQRLCCTAAREALRVVLSASAVQRPFGPRNCCCPVRSVRIGSVRCPVRSVLGVCVIEYRLGKIISNGAEVMARDPARPR
eukprot:8880136-Alexandrium_andersonii.AAC.1